MVRQKARRDVEAAQHRANDVQHAAAEARAATETACEQRISNLLEQLDTLRVSMEAETARADAAEAQLALQHDAAARADAAWDELMAAI